MERSTAVAAAAYDTADLHHAAEAGIRAPSLHNSQPWLFTLRGGGIEIRVDPDRRLVAAYVDQKKVRVKGSVS